MLLKPEPQPVRIIGLVREQHIGRCDLSQKVERGRDVVDIARGEQEGNRPSLTVTQCVYLGRPAAA